MKKLQILTTIFVLLNIALVCTSLSLFSKLRSAQNANRSLEAPFVQLSPNQEITPPLIFQNATNSPSANQPNTEISVAEKAAKDAEDALSKLPLSVISASQREDETDITIIVSPDLRFFEIPQSFNCRIVPSLSSPVSYSISGANTIKLHGDFSPETDYCIMLGEGWTRKSNSQPITPIPVVVRTGKPIPEFRMNVASSQMYYPALRKQLRFPFTSRFVTNLNVVIKRAYRNNVSFLGISEWEHRNIAEEICRTTIPINGVSHQKRGYFLNIGQLLPNPDPGFYLVEVETVAKRPHYSWWSERVEFEPIRSSFSFALTDLALHISTEPGRNREAVAFVTSFATGKPLKDVEVICYTRTHQVAGKGLTNDRGIATIQLNSNVKSGEFLTAATASLENDFTYLQLNCESLVHDASNVNGSLDRCLALVFSERDICRPGERFESSVFVRSSPTDGAKAFAKVPITLKCFDARGQLVDARRLITDNYGFARTEWEIPGNAEVGTWRVVCEMAGKPLHEMSMMVAAYVPDRFRVSLSPSSNISFGYNGTINFHGRADYYFGQPVSLGTYRFKSTISNAPHPKHWQGWHVGNDSPPAFVNYSETGDLNNGQFSVSYPGLERNGISEDKASLFNPLDLCVVTDVQEPGGRNVSAMDRVTYFLTDQYIGIRQVEPKCDSGIAFELAALPALPGAKVKKEVNVCITLQQQFWDRNIVDKNGSLQVEWSSRWQDCGRKYFDIEGDQNGIPHPLYVEFPNISSCGHFRVIASSGDEEHSSSQTASPKTNPENNQPASVAYAIKKESRFDFWHWSGEVQEHSMSPSSLSLEAGAPSYKPGEEALLRFRSPIAGNGLVTAGDNGFSWKSSLCVTQGLNEVHIPIPNSTIAGRYYASITVIAQNASENQRLSGIAAIPIKQSSLHKINLSLSLPETAAPNQEISLSLRLTDENHSPVGGLVKIGAIDEGVAALSDFHVPKIYDHFFNRNFGSPFRMNDAFGLIYPNLRIMPNGKFGGDGIFKSLMKMSRNRESIIQTESVRLALPPVIVGTNGEASVKISLPKHLGALRFMAVAANEWSVGSTEESIVIREKVSASTTAPRFVVGGDSFTLTTTLFNHEANDDAWSLSINLPAELSADGKAINLVRNGLLPRGSSCIEHFQLSVPVSAQGVASITTSFSIGNETHLSESFVNIQPKNPFITSSHHFSITGGVLRIPSMQKDWITVDNAEITLSSLPIDSIRQSLSWLTEYPHGCLEQTTAAAFPFLAVGDLKKLGLIDATIEASARARMKAAYAQILQMALPDGSFSMWSWQSNTWQYGTLFAAHFIFEAEAAGYIQVGSEVKSRIITWLKKLAQNASLENREDRAYAAYVLGLAGEITYINTARNILAANSNDFAAYLAATAMMRFGYAYEGAKIFDALLQSEVWNCPNLNDRTWKKGFALFLAAKTGTQNLAALMKAALDLGNEIRPTGSAWGTTQNNAWASIGLATFAARLETKPGKGLLSIGESSETLDFSKKLTSRSFALKEDVMISNDGPVHANVKIYGIPKDLVATNTPIRISRTYYDEKGNTVQQVRKGDLITAVISIETDKDLSDLVLVDRIPGGFELEDVKLSTRSTQGMSIPTIDPQVHRGRGEIRDDRWIWYGDVKINQSARDKAFVLAYYHIRAVVPGQFSIPSITIEEMYNPDNCGHQTSINHLTIQ